MARAPTKRKVLLNASLDPKDPHPFLHSRLHLTLVAEFSRLSDTAADLTAALLLELAHHLGDPKVSGTFFRREPEWTDRPGRLPVERSYESTRATLSQLAADSRLPALGRDYPSLLIIRELGKLDTRRVMLMLHWSGGRTPDSPHTLVLSLSIADTIEPDPGRLMAITHRFFDLAAATGVCTYGLGDIADDSESAEGSYYTFGPYQGGHSRFQRCLENELWRMAKDRRHNFVRGVFWANYLSPLHVQRLGGPATLAEFRAIADRGVEGYSGTAREYPDGSALIILSPLTEFTFMIQHLPWFQGDIMIREARWLAIKLAQARLPIWFDEAGISKPTDGADHKRPEAPVPPTAEEIAAYMAHMWANPPRCIAAVAKRPTAKEIAATQIDQGRYTTMFHIAPNGKQAPLQVWGRPTPAPPNRSPDAPALSPPILAGAPLATLAPFTFDPRTDGYNGELGLSLSPRPGKPRSLTCPECNHDHFNLTASFEYSGGNEELTDPDLIERRQDFFSWFTLTARCASCRRRLEIASVECA